MGGACVLALSMKGGVTKVMTRSCRKAEARPFACRQLPLSGPRLRPSL